MARPRIFYCDRSDPRQGSRGCSCRCTVRQWGLLNLGMIQALARMVNQSADRVGQFLHQLTLQLFARILYPLMAGWNTRRIPFTLPDTCEHYYNIFDEDGNIRCPIPTRTLLILITMMQYVLNLPRQCCKRKCKCSSTGDSLKDIHNPGYCQNVVPFSGRRNPMPSESSPTSDISAGLKRLGYYNSNDDLKSYPSDESITYGYAPHRCPCQGSEAPRKPVPNPYANISGPLALQSACEQELRSPLLASDCKPRSPLEGMSPDEVQCYYIANISNLYTAVVEDRHSRPLMGERKSPKQRIIPCQEKLRSAGGMISSQLYSWSWLCRRDPQKMTQIPSGKTITPYRCQSIGKEDQGLGSNYNMVKPLKENSLLPRDCSHQALEPLRPPQRLEFNIDSFPEASKNRSQSLVKLNLARPVKDPFDYWKEMMERERSRSISRPIRNERNISISKNDINPHKLDRSKNLNRSKSLESVKSKRVSKILIIEAHRRQIGSAPNMNDLSEDQQIQSNVNRSNQLIDTKFKPLRTKTVDGVQRSLGGIIGDTPKIQNYSSSEKSRKETSKEQSKERNYSRKVAGETLLFITPARVMTSHPKLERPKEYQAPPKDTLTLKKPLLNQKTIDSLRCLEKKVQFRVPILHERQQQLSKSANKPIIYDKPKSESADQTESLNKSLPKANTRSLEGNDKERMNRKIHFQKNILRIRSYSRDKTRKPSPEPVLRFPNLFLALSRRIKEGSQ